MTFLIVWFAGYCCALGILSANSEEPLSIKNFLIVCFYSLGSWAVVGGQIGKIAKKLNVDSGFDV